VLGRQGGPEYDTAASESHRSEGATRGEATGAGGGGHGEKELACLVICLVCACVCMRVCVCARKVAQVVRSSLAHGGRYICIRMSVSILMCI